MDNQLSRRRFIGLTGAGMMAASLANSPALGKQNADLPNFIIVFTDDQGYNDLGCFGSPNIKTPNVDQMATEGMKFTDFYTSCSICSPARASILTGCYARRVGFMGQALWVKDTPKDTRTGLHPNEITLAELLKAKDYKTACIGKWHLGDHDPFLPTRQGFDYFYGIAYSNDMDEPSREEPPLPLMRNEEVIEQPVDNNLLTKKCTEEAVQYIKDNKDNPFFLYLAHPAPHDPPGASPDFQGKSEAGIYGDAVEELDWSTGQILQTLKDLGIDQNTFVVFTSDNGPWLQDDKIGGSADPLKGGKFDGYEGGLRMPCVMWWPGTIPAGSTCSEISTIMDFYVTFAALTGIELPQDRTIDGKNILPLMTGEADAATPWEYFLYYGAKHITGEDAYAIRSGKWKYLRAKRLYDLSQDIGETTDVDDENQELADSLRAKLLELDSEIEDNVRPLGDVDELTSVYGKTVEQPGQFRMTNYPNPFNSGTTLEFTPDSPGKGLIRIVDIQGRTRLQKKMQFLAGVKINERIVFKGLPTGVYYARLEIGGRHLATRRMVYLK